MLKEDSKEYVILVDKEDNKIGLMEKMEAHEKALLHRAFSVFIFNKQGEFLLQRRALSKYHSGGLWTNTCCSHPRDGETHLEAGKRRLQEEMGFVCDLEKQFDFIYKSELDNELTEHELDHVLFGKYDGPIEFNKEEVMDYKYVDLDSLIQDMNNQPEKYTEWFKICFAEVKTRLV